MSEPSPSSEPAVGLCCHSPTPSRRSLLTGAGMFAAAAALTGISGKPAHASPQPPAGRRARTRVVLLGTAGGPALATAERAGISTAVVYEDRVYIVDLGEGAPLRLRESGLVAPGNVLGNVRGVFFTHMHSDHVSDWPSMYMTAVPALATGGRRDGLPIQVFGPGDRGSLPRVYPPGRPAPPVVHPEEPTLGIAGMTSYLRRALAADLNDRMRDNGLKDPDEVIKVNEIDLAGVWDIDPAGVPPRLTEPIKVWDDGDVRVTATLVDHHPTAPAFAFRFDTPDGSVVVSGDTTVSENLIDLARDADLLLHEAVDTAWVESATAGLPPEQREAARAHMIEAHTTIEQVGRDVAEPAGARTLVLTHLGPPTSPESRWRQARKGYSGRLVVGRDLMELGVGGR